MVRWRPPASARTCLACASFELKDGVVGSAQQRGEKRVIMNPPKPGSATAVGAAPLAGAGAMSGPPQELAIRTNTENAILAVVKSSMSLAKCSSVVMTVSKID